MSINVNYIEMPDHLLVITKGEWTTEDATAKLDEIKSEAKKRNIHRLLLDLRSLKMPESELVRFDTSEYIAKKLGPPIKLATICNPQDINRFAENLAVNRGANLKVFTDRQDACDWLTCRFTHRFTHR